MAPPPIIPVETLSRNITLGLFPQENIQVTSGTPTEARSESVIAVNPRNPNNMIGASKRFSDITTYRFTIGVRVTLDGGTTWQDSTPPLLPEWSRWQGDLEIEGPGMTDPAVVFDLFGNAFMVGEPLRYKDATGEKLETIGMFIYKSTDGGLHWSAPGPLRVGDRTDDKSWIACDNNPLSPHFGNVYVVWGAVSPLRFARSTDHGDSWKGVGNAAPGSQIADSTFAPEVSVGLDGTVHVAWYFDGEDEGSDQPGTTIEYVRSIDGGNSFEPQKSIVRNVHGLRGNLPELGQKDRWPHFPGATFRVITLATGCAFGADPVRTGLELLALQSNFVVAWSDFREGSARIYYRTSSDGGVSFDGPDSGQPLLGSQPVNSNLHHFHPQIVCTGSGVIGCAYYEYGPKAGQNLIDVKLSASFDIGETFSHTATVTSKPWNPAVDAPYSHGDKEVTFIGEYFGLDADDEGFDVLWTDTRSGVQELFYARVDTQRINPPEVIIGIPAQVLYGLLTGGGGAILENGHIVPVPPPDYDLVRALQALNAASQITGASGRALTRHVYSTIEAIAAAGVRSLQD
jgi:hypothetical protein